MQVTAITIEGIKKLRDDIKQKIENYYQNNEKIENEPYIMFDETETNSNSHIMFSVMTSPRTTLLYFEFEAIDDKNEIFKVNEWPHNISPLYEKCFGSKLLLFDPFDYLTAYVEATHAIEKPSNSYRVYEGVKVTVIHFTGEIGTYWRESRIEFENGNLTDKQISQKVLKFVENNRIHAKAEKSSIDLEKLVLVTNYLTNLLPVLQHQHKSLDLTLDEQQRFIVQNEKMVNELLELNCGITSNPVNLMLYNGEIKMTLDLI